MELNYWTLSFLGLGLLIAVIFDLVHNRIPNWLVLGMIFTGLLVHVIELEWASLLPAFLGLFIGFMCFLPLHVFGALGAGDVKLLAAVGSLVGPANVLLIALATIVAGGVIALCYITLRGGLFQMVRRYHSMIILMMAHRTQYLPPASDEAASLRFPYAIAIACGTVISLFYF